MKKYKYITGIALAATMLTACSGLDDDIPAAEQTVPVTFYIRAASPATRATEDTQAGITEENTIHTAKVWLYRSAFTDAEGDHEPLLLGYRELTGNSDELEGTINVAKSVIDANRHVDIYAVGNAESAGLGTMNAGTDFATSYLGGTNFVPATRTTSAGVPDAGLPMSQIAMNKTVYVDGSGPNYYIDGIDMVRAVSKVRFAFARTTGTEGVQIMAIEIDGNLIPNQERIFPKQTADNYAPVEGIQYNGDRYTNINTTGSDDDYDANMMVYGYAKTGTPAQYSTALLSHGSIMEHVWPKWFDINYAGVTGSTYEARIDSLLGVSNYDFTTYLRESDKAITGHIYYRFSNDGEVKSVPFTMDSPSGTTKTAEDFARNHIYTVYGYFMGGKMILTVTVQPWDLVERTLDYKDVVIVTRQIHWDEDTYDVSQSDLENHIITLRNRTIAECTFQIGTPEGFTWTAVFNTVSGSPQAFKFVDDEGNELNEISGLVGEGVVTLRIKAAVDDVAVQQSATLDIIVRNVGGANIPISSLSSGGDVQWTIQQNNSL